MLKHVQEVMDTAKQFVAKGATVWFKWTCVGCQSRQTFEQENTLFTTGQCEECGHVTDLMNDARANVNYLMHLQSGAYRP